MGKFDNKNISIYGLGNIGYNIGKKLIEKNNNINVQGFDITKEKSTIANESNAITKEMKSYIDSIEDCDILIISTPTSSTYEIFESLSGIISNKTIIFDICSSKRAISEWSYDLLPDNEIIGLYPFINHDSILNNNWGLVSYRNTKDNVTNMANTFVQEMEGLVINIDITEHDSFVALTETMPMILSSNLLNLSNSNSSWKEVYKYFNNDDFKLFSSSLDNDPIKIFSSISTNNDLLLEWIKLYISELVKLQKLLENNLEKDIADLVNKTWEDRLKITNNIDPSIDTGENIIPSSSENMLSLFIGSRAARFFTKSKEIDKDKYGFEKRI
ncbi:MAG: prephenate dehydrogenase/arogenate dehydrogenase family protein [Dehalococcoidia bacterium]|nr:hypothetical protein [Chloroflexota bacterium]RZP14025.1 MAG: prephenate dehydrogenase/arogenate dehydrogenase family protein [Chloroflexota bacterium]|tara:strand:+ start:35028 stop:36014 length:987 start_codon:yes stop_codon:yes gene_type:complete